MVIYIVGVFLSGIIEQTYMSGIDTQWNTLVDPLGNPIAKATVIWNMSWFDFAMFEHPDGTPNELMPLRYGLMILSAAFWWTMAMAVGQGLASVAKSLFKLGL